VIERVPLAETLGVAHLQSDGVALQTVRSLSNCPGALAIGALFCQIPMPEMGRDQQGLWRIQRD
jgi:hypothetical protein